MEAAIQAQEARIQQLQAQNRSDADQRERERLKLASEFRSEITVLRSQMGTEPAASASSRPPGLEGHARSNLGMHEKWKDWSMMQKAYMMAVDAEYVETFGRLDSAAVTMSNGSLSPRSSKLNAQLC